MGKAKRAHAIRDVVGAALTRVGKRKDVCPPYVTKLKKLATKRFSQLALKHFSEFFFFALN